MSQPQSAVVVALLVLAVALAVNEILAQHWRQRALRRRLLLLAALAAGSVSVPGHDRLRTKTPVPDIAPPPDPPVAGAPTDGGADGRPPHTMLAVERDPLAMGDEVLADLPRATLEATQVATERSPWAAPSSSPSP